MILTELYKRTVAEDTGRIGGWIYVMPNQAGSQHLARFRNLDTGEDEVKKFSTIEDLAQWLASTKTGFDWGGYGAYPKLKEKLLTMYKQYSGKGLNENSQETYNQVYQIMVRGAPEFMKHADSADVKKAIVKAMGFGNQISAQDLASYAYGLLKSNAIDESGQAEKQLSEIGDTPAGRAALKAVDKRAAGKMDAWAANPKSGYSSTPADVQKATKAAVAAGNRLHGFGAVKEQDTAEGAMPDSVIKLKTKLAAMSAEEFAGRVKDRSDEELRAMARRHGYGKNDSYYVNKRNQGQSKVHENYNPEYDDEAGMAENNLETLKRAVDGLDQLIQPGDNLPEWCQEKIAVAKSMLVSVWDYMYSEESSDEVDPEIDAMFEAMDQLAEEMAAKNGVDKDMVWESFESLPDNVLYETAAWRRKEGKSKKGGLNAKGVASYRRENPGSKLQMAVTTKPSKLKPGSKAAKRRKSFCARMSGVKGPMKKPNGKPTRKALALRKWNC